MACRRFDTWWSEGVEDKGVEETDSSINGSLLTGESLQAKKQKEKRKLLLLLSILVAVIIALPVVVLADDYYSPSGDNEIYGTYVSILTLPLMHSEDTDAHHL